MDKYTIENLELFYGDFKALKNINMKYRKKKSPHLSGRPAAVNPHFLKRSTA